MITGCWYLSSKTKTFYVASLKITDITTHFLPSQYYNTGYHYWIPANIHLVQMICKDNLHCYTKGLHQKRWWKTSRFCAWKVCTGRCFTRKGSGTIERGRGCSWKIEGYQMLAWGVVDSGGPPEGVSVAPSPGVSLLSSAIIAIVLPGSCCLPTLLSTANTLLCSPGTI